VQRFQRSALSGSIRLGATDDVAVNRVAGIAGRFRWAHPAIRLKVRVASSLKVAEWVDSGDVDLAVMPVEQHAVRDGDFVLWKDELRFVQAADGEYSTEDPLPLVTFGPQCFYGRVAAALLDAAGIDVPDEFHGDSLLPVIRGAESDEDGEAFVQISESQVGRALRTDRWKYAVAASKETGWRGGNGEPASDCYVERYLYDLRRDPIERINLAGRPNYRDVADRLQRRLLDHIEAVEGDRPTIKQLERGYKEY
jgi:DNA-binding transcriptional LysR family regulator